MSLLNFLKFQPIEETVDEASTGHRHEEKITLDNDIDEAELEHYWDDVVEDIHKDPEWFNFDDE